jgi:hypothetical protein
VESRFLAGADGVLREWTRAASLTCGMGSCTYAASLPGGEVTALYGGSE